MPRFVVLEHDHPHRHWDLLLEAEGALRAWRLAEPPQPGRAAPAEPLPDHRPHYLDYEGPVSGGRGHVRRWDAGTFTWRADESGRIEVELHGQRCRGAATVAVLAGGGWVFALAAAANERRMTGPFPRKRMGNRFQAYDETGPGMDWNGFARPRGSSVPIGHGWSGARALFCCSASARIVPSR
jgi:hypothetical protein